MAGAPTAAERPQKLSCSICLQTCPHAVILECGHCYCKSCIAQTPKGPKGTNAFCPICWMAPPKKGGTPEPEKRNHGGSQLSREGHGSGTCREHDESLKLYCQDDGMLACMVCSLSQKHTGHRFQPIQEAMDTYKEKLRSQISQMKSELKSEEGLGQQQEQKLKEHEELVFVFGKQLSSEFHKINEFLHSEEKTMKQNLEAEANTIQIQMQKNILKIQNNCWDIQEIITLQASMLDVSEPEDFLPDIQEFLERSRQKQETVMSGDSTVVSRQLSYGDYRGPIQYTVWKSMRSVIMPDLSSLTLDPNTAHPNLVISENHTCVARSLRSQKVPKNRERFEGRLAVLGSEGFTRGRHYWEVDVGETTAWEVGVVKESIDRKSSAMMSREDCITIRPPDRALNIRSHRIGVYLDYEAGQVSFYNAELSEKLYHIDTHRHTFHERLYPYFSLGISENNRTTEHLRILHNKV